MSEKLVAIAPFLSSCPGVITLGIRASLGDYSSQEREIMLSARRIFFPTPRFARIFEAAGKSTFPSGFAYRVRESRLVQEALFQFLGCPHPRTRIYFGRQKQSVPDDFALPFRAMGPHAAHAGGLVTCRRELKQLSEKYNPLIVQEISDDTERFRLTFVNYECVGTARLNIPRAPHSEESAGVGQEHLCDIQRLLRSVHLDDIAVEIGFTGHGWKVIEFCRPPLKWESPRGIINRHHLISRLIEKDYL